MMFDVNSIADKMAGEEHRQITIDARKYLTSTGPGSVRIDRESAAKEVENLFTRWEVLRKYEDYFSGDRAFHVEDQLCIIAAKDPSVFNGIDSVIIMHPNNDIYIFIYHNKDILKAYAGLTADGGSAYVEYKSNGVVLIKKYAGFNGDNTQKSIICIDCTCDIQSGVSVPAGLKINTPVKLDNNKSLSPLVVSKYNSLIEISGNVMIEAPVPIIADGVKSVIIKGTGTLSLTCTEGMQPCIGTVTTTGMSYGRWSPNGTPPEEIVVDGVSIICKSSVENFTLGKYGSEKVPKIVTINGGRIICPEADGTRVITKQAKAPEGSTKISTSMQYEILKNGMAQEELLNPQVKEYMKQLPERWHKYITLKTQPENVSEAIRLLNMNKDLDVELILDSDSEMSNARVATLLRNKDIYNNKEFMLESNKLEYLVSKYSDMKSILAEADIQHHEIVCCLITAIRDTLGVSISDYDYEVLYDMIPSYYFDNWVRGDKKGSVEKYIEESSSSRKLIGKIHSNLRISECIKDLQL